MYILERYGCMCFCFLIRRFVLVDRSLSASQFSVEAMFYGCGLNVRKVELPVLRGLSNQYSNKNHITKSLIFNYGGMHVQNPYWRLISTLRIFINYKNIKWEDKRYKEKGKTNTLGHVPKNKTTQDFPTYLWALYWIYIFSCCTEFNDFLKFFFHMLWNRQGFFWSFQQNL